MEKVYKLGSSINGRNSTPLPKDMVYVYSPICKEFKTFTLGEDCIHNAHSDMYKAPYDYEYVSAVTEEKYTSGTTVSCVCDFESYGAPIIVFTDDISRNGAHRVYGAHFEVVAYEGGCNVWYIEPDPSNTARPIRTNKVAFKQFTIGNNEKINMSVTVGRGRVSVNINGETLELEHSAVPDTFHAGITACEGLNRFYELRINRD